MKESIQIHYLEIVTPDVEQLCTIYSNSLGVAFTDAINELGGARTTTLSGGSFLDHYSWAGFK